MGLDEEEGTSHLETAFVASKKTNKDKQNSIAMTCTCQCEEKGDDGEGLSDEEYAYFMRKLKLGKGKFEGKLPLICFGCGEVGNFVEKFPNKSDGNSKGNKGFKKFNKQGKKKGSKRNFLSKEDSSSSDEESDSKEEANEKVLFMAKHNKQEVSNNEEEGLTIEQFYMEAIKLIKDLKAENICSNTLEEQVQGLKIEVEEHKCIEESLQKKLEESNQEREALEAEVVSLHKEVKKGKTIQNYANSSRALEELINNKRSYNDKTGISYKEEEVGPSTKKYNEPMRFNIHVDFIG